MSVGEAKLDAFESLFRSAVKDVFHLAPPALGKVALLTDLDRTPSNALRDKVAGYLATIDSGHDLVWEVLPGEVWTETSTPLRAALDTVKEHEPDLLVTYRHLLRPERDVPYTLGAVVDSLTQALDIPILLLPSPTPEGFVLPAGTHNVLVVTDHLTGDDALVNYGVHFCHKQGQLFLAHIEDDAVLERYLSAIGKLPELDTELAEKQLPEKLLQLPSDYIESVARVLAEARIDETVIPLVQLGHGVTAYEKLVAEHAIDLLVFHTKDSRQDAMLGLAHALAVQIRNVPLLLL